MKTIDCRIIHLRLNVTSSLPVQEGRLAPRESPEQFEYGREEEHQDLMDVRVRRVRIWHHS